MSAADALGRVAADYWELRLREEPVLARDLGDARYRQELFHESIADYQRRDAAHAQLLARLADVAAADLAPDERITHQLLHRELGEAREHFAFQSHLRPVLFPMGPEGAISYAAQKTTLDSPADAEDYLARLATIPGYFADQRERLEAGIAAGYRLPGVLLERILASIDAFCSGPVESNACFKPLASAGGRDPGSYAALRDSGRALIEQRVVPACRGWQADLKRLLANHCRDSVAISEEPDGAAYYAFLARHFTTTTLTPAEIHDIGHAEVARIRGEMSAIAKETGFDGDLARLRQFIATDPRFIAPSKDALRERVDVLAKTIDRRIPEFFGRIPRMTYGVESIPPALSAQLPPAYAQPSPPSGASAGVFWITGLPERCPTPMLVPMTMHEAWPGHLMHIALLQELTDLPAFRRNALSNYTAYLEGWAMYCEKLGFDFGLYADPYDRYGQLDMEIWRAVRLVVDTGLHAFGWSRARAITYMAEYVSLPQGAIEAEIDRYIGWPGQALGYKIGEIRVRELRERATRRLGAHLDLRRFHDCFSDAGPVTLDLLEAHVEAWIARAEAQVASPRA